MRRNRDAGAIESVVRLGFSPYEAKAYVGLLDGEAQTAYALSKRTGVPQPKVYETLRRLVDRSAVVQVADDPARFVAIPADRLLVRLKEDFQDRLDGAGQRLQEIQRGPTQEWPQVVWELEGYAPVMERAKAVINGARQKVYMSARTEEFRPLQDAVAQASQRGVEVILLHFGPKPFEVAHGRAFQHMNSFVTERNPQARHLAAVADTTAAVWALAPDGRAWRGLCATDGTFGSIVKAYIRHDVFIQRIHSDLSEELRARYGADLERLTDLSAEIEPPVSDRRRRVAAAAPRGGGKQTVAAIGKRASERDR